MAENQLIISGYSVAMEKAKTEEFTTQWEDMKKDKVARTKEIDENTIIDFDEKGQVIGVEILFIKERNPTILNELQVEKLISA